MLRFLLTLRYPRLRARRQDRPSQLYLVWAENKAEAAGCGSVTSLAVVPATEVSPLQIAKEV